LPQLLPGVFEPKTSAAELQRYYPDQYHAAWVEAAETDSHFCGEYAARTALVRSVCGVPGRALDVGCGTGDFLAMLRDTGWDVTGTEWSAGAAAQASARHGLNVLVGELDSLSLPSARYDVVMMWHVLEHLPDPVGVLKECARILAPSGFLVVATPNAESLALRVFRRYWYHLDAPRHVSLWSPRVLQRATEPLGYRTVRVSAVLTDHNSASWAMSLLRLSKRVLSRARDSARPQLSAGTSLGGSGKDFVYRVLSGGSLPLRAIENAAGRPSTFEVVLRK
jgi:SAM-dependent methyltransferase